MVRNIFRAVRSRLGGPDVRALRKTFGFAKGLEKPTAFARFDIRNEICLQVGGFKHGQVVRDREGTKYVAVGVRPGEEGMKLPQLWFWPKSLEKPASCCFTGVSASALTSLLSFVDNEQLKQLKPEDCDAAEDSDGECVNLCHECLLPLGTTKYPCKGGDGFIHGECMARNLLDQSQEDGRSKVNDESRKKARNREEYNIGWRPERMVPCNEEFFLKRKLPRPPGAKPESMYCLVIEKDGTKAATVRAVQTSDPESSINLNFLVTALQVRIKAGMAPYFSLDTPRADEQWQVKTFGPPWLKGTAVGEVLFQADYHLKELSMGDSLFEQPVIGMKSCWDFSWDEQAWRGREWFVVKQAKVFLSDNNVLLPHVQMGVEARQQVANDKKQLVDAPVTSKGHPLVKYAELFTHNFDLIAERKSVVYQLREVSKAAIVAKFLVDHKVSLDDFWLSAPDELGLCKMELPFNREERTTHVIMVCDGAIREQHGGVLTSTTGLYGGVDLNIDAFDLSMPIRVDRRIETPDFAAIYADPSNLGTSEELATLSQRQLRRLVGDAGGSVPVGPAEKVDLIDLLLKLRARDDEREPADAAEEEDAAVAEELSKLPLSPEMVKKVLQVIRTASGKPAGSSEKKPSNGGFWESLNEDTENATVFRSVFFSNLSDRQQEHTLFVPPIQKQTYVQSLKTLVEEEKQAQENRRKHFFSKDFVSTAPGPLFPSAWQALFSMHFGRGSSVAAGGDKARTRQLVDSEADGNTIVKGLKPSFDRNTEDGARFRIYRRGTVEVRTVQERGQDEEHFGAVFEVCPGAAPSPQSPLAKVTEFVRAGVDGSTLASASAEEPVDKRPDSAKYCYFVVYETDLGDAIVTEQLADGTISLEENPPDMEERFSQARVLRVADCHGVGTTVGDVRRHQRSITSKKVGKPRSARLYARSAFDVAGGTPIDATSAQGPPPLQPPAMQQQQPPTVDQAQGQGPGKPRLAVPQWQGQSRSKPSQY